MNRNLYFTVFFLFGVLSFFSNNSGVPQAVTKAPGESGLNCGACHSGGNFNPKIELGVKDSLGNPVSNYKPNNIYSLEVKVSGDNNPKAFGFQMVSLSATNNSDQGNWSSLGSRVKTITLLQRKYLVQSAARDDGLFTMKWKAPTADIGPVSFYFSGLAINQNGNTSGDSPVSNKLTLGSSTSTTNPADQMPPFTVYPNPVQEVLFLSAPEAVKEINIFDGKGQKVLGQTTDFAAGIQVRDLTNGIYFIDIQYTRNLRAEHFSFVKF